MMLQTVAPPATTSFGSIAVTDFMGRDTLTSPMTGPASGIQIKASGFEAAVSAARKFKTLVDPGVLAVIDAGKGVVELRPVTMDHAVENLMRSRSFGSAKIVDSPKELLGVFDYRIAIAAH